MFLTLPICFCLSCATSRWAASHHAALAAVAPPRTFRQRAGCHHYSLSPGLPVLVLADVLCLHFSLVVAVLSTNSSSFLLSVWLAGGVGSPRPWNNLQTW